MKIKEYLPSLRAARHLQRLPLAKLKTLSDNSLPVIVTLTSIPSRLEKLHITIRSLLNQSHKPEKIILWLHEELKTLLPKELLVLQGETFEIHYVNLKCSHRKLIHSLKIFPQHILVTCDDDLIYSHTWLNRLYQSHLAFPEDIIAHECRRISIDASGNLLPYKEWPTQKEPNVTDQSLLAIGYGGVLYPPNSLMDKVTDVELFMRLAPKADDLWFKAMSILKGTQVRKSIDSYPKPIPIIGSQKFSLQKQNVMKDMNRIQWLALSEHFTIRLHA